MWGPAVGTPPLRGLFLWWLDGWSIKGCCCLLSSMVEADEWQLLPAFCPSPGQACTHTCSQAGMEWPGEPRVATDPWRSSLYRGGHWPQSPTPQAGVQAPRRAVPWPPCWACATSNCSFLGAPASAGPHGNSVSASPHSCLSVPFPLPLHPLHLSPLPLSPSPSPPPIPAVV